MSNSGWTTLRVLSRASECFAVFGIVTPTSCTVRPLLSQCTHVCQSRCFSHLIATVTHSFDSTFQSVSVGSIGCAQGSRNLTVLSELCASRETINTVGERRTQQRSLQHPRQRKKAFLLSVSSSREIFTCFSKGVSSKEAGEVLISQLRSALAGWQLVRCKSGGKKTKHSDDEVSDYFCGDGLLKRMRLTSQ